MGKQIKETWCAYITESYSVINKVQRRDLDGSGRCRVKHDRQEEHMPCDLAHMSICSKLILLGAKCWLGEGGERWGMTAHRGAT